MKNKSTACQIKRRFQRKLKPLNLIMTIWLRLHKLLKKLLPSLKRKRRRSPNQLSLNPMRNQLPRLRKRSPRRRLLPQNLRVTLRKRWFHHPKRLKSLNKHQLCRKWKKRRSKKSLKLRRRKLRLRSLLPRKRSRRPPKQPLPLIPKLLPPRRPSIRPPI